MSKMSHDHFTPSDHSKRGVSAVLARVFEAFVVLERIEWSAPWQKP